MIIIVPAERPVVQNVCSWLYLAFVHTDAVASFDSQQVTKSGQQVDRPVKTNLNKRYRLAKLYLQMGGMFTITTLKKVQLLYAPLKNGRKLIVIVDQNSTFP